MDIRVLYKEVTDRIVAELENGTVPWLKPWKGGNGILPVNGATSRPYSGVNILLLWDARERNGFTTNRWMTFIQAKEKGACVRKGEKGSSIIFTKRVTLEDDDHERHYQVVKTHNVFNADQIDGLETVATRVVTEEEKVEAAERLISPIGADIRYGGDRAFFTPTLDFIQIPLRQAFTEQSGFYSTLFHELGHFSGHKSRLNRDLSGRFGDRSYAAEELIAELCSAFLCAVTGVEGELRHAAYIQSWISLLKDDDRAVFTAASHASKAADYLRTFSENVIEEAA